MKTIIKDGNYERVDNKTADLRVNSQGWNFVSKSEWKKNVRDLKSSSEPETEKPKKVKKK